MAEPLPRPKRRRLRPPVQAQPQPPEFKPKGKAPKGDE